ncbi:uncharacterized protein BO72DRAFT_255298 [Aspergillus fijiensis CBS 313.89]|uniref:Uncharacterized protein n=1 Tax=Aspergillus fijiensis CBS 313.89 TaxID=1448319 RepID=A0A8G1RHD8_9EURO|nr:uncharacterized protein BO72DRAFT_255298 [Aspergillus fijiensis CBS 313.89]RAK72869.1 hypothetical protein BO72DRAFT_255298 [Aspergillus fijiensis CBS 313.89]
MVDTWEKEAELLRHGDPSWRQGRFNRHLPVSDLHAGLKLAANLPRLSDFQRSSMQSYWLRLNQQHALAICLISLVRSDPSQTTNAKGPSTPSPRPTIKTIIDLSRSSHKETWRFLMTTRYHANTPTPNLITCLFAILIARIWMRVCLAVVIELRT